VSIQTMSGFAAAFAPAVATPTTATDPPATASAVHVMSAVRCPRLRPRQSFIAIDELTV
jgi:hypothetical protein